MMSVLRSAVVAAFSCLAFSPIAHGYVGKTAKSSLAKTDKVDVGHRVIRAKATGDGRLGVFSGNLTRVKSVRPAEASTEEFVQTSFEFIESHPEYFGKLKTSDLSLDGQAMLKNEKEQFFKFRVYRDGLLIEDAHIDFRYKFGELVQVANYSYQDAVSDRRSARKNLQSLVKTKLEVAQARHMQQIYRVEEQKNGYVLVKIDVFAVERDGEPFQAQMESATGNIFELKPLRYYLDGRAHGQAFNRYYEDELIDVNFNYLTLGTNSGVVKTDGNGKFNAEAGSNPKLSGFKGSFVTVRSLTGSDLSADASETGGVYDLNILKDPSSEGYADKNVAQAMTFFHTNLIISEAKKYIENSWLNATLTANTNLNDSCNAHWDGSTINMYSADDECANTGNISDVIYHEWGHGLDDAFGGIEDGAFSEGFGDIMSLVMTGSNILGIGFFLDGEAVRDLEPDLKYPDDEGEVHDEGLIIAGAFYDLYKGLVAKHGETLAQDLLKNFAFKAIAAVSTYLEVYDALLVIDDNDSNLDNGTPNMCIINEAFVPHGLTTTSSACLLGNLTKVDLTEIVGNQNGYLEPGETANVSPTMWNNTAEVLIGLIGTAKIVPNVQGITLATDTLVWEDIAVGEAQSATNSLSLSVDESVACGQSFNVDFNLKGNGRDVKISKSLLVGHLLGIEQAFAGENLPIEIPDVETVAANATISGEQWQNGATVLNARLKFDITHSYQGDLKVTLVSPSGKRNTVFVGAGSAEDVHFDEDVTALIAGEAGQGVWQLEVEDTAEEDDGQLTSYQLTLTPALFECE